MINENQAQLEQSSEVDSLLKQTDFGTVLKRAREKAGLSIDEVADKLIVSADIIKAIDNSQADALPALTFTQGYIRSYARMFDLPADEIIDAYNNVVPDTKKITAPRSVLLVHNSGSGAIVKLLSSAFIVAAAAALFMWIYQTDFTLNTKLSFERETFDKPSMEAPGSQFEYRAEQQQEQAVLDDTLHAEQDSITQTSSFVDDVPQGLTASNTQSTSPETAAVQNSLESTEVADNKTENGLAVSHDELLLVADADSWCEIQDANGQRLYYQLLEKGEEAKVKGPAPFHVFLGNAPQVRVEINSTIVNFDHLINNNSKIANLNISSDAKVVRFSARKLLQQ